MRRRRGSIVRATVISCVLLVASVVLPASAAAVDPLWTALYSGPAGTQSQRAQAVAMGTDGGVYVVGVSTYTFGQAEVVPWLVKYAADGTLVWEACPSDVVRHGQFLGVTAMPGGDILAWGSTGRYGGDLLTVRYQADGTRLWATRIRSGVDSGSCPADIAVDAQGDIYLAGTIGNRSTYDAILAKLDPSGRLLWRRTIAGDPNQYDALTAAAVGRSGNVYVCGYVTRRGMYCPLMASYSASGTKRWMHTSLNCGLTDLVTASSGTVYACGGGPARDRGFSVIRAYSPNGTLLFGRRTYAVKGLGGAFLAVKLDAEGHVICAGDTNTRDGWGDYLSDFLTAEYDAQGALLFRDVWSGASGREDWVYGVECGTDGSIFVCGESMGIDSCSLVVVPYDAAGVRGEPMFHGTGLTLNEDSRASALSPSGPVIVGSREYMLDGHINALTVQFPMPTPAAFPTADSSGRD